MAIITTDTKLNINSSKIFPLNEKVDESTLILKNDSKTRYMKVYNGQGNFNIKLNNNNYSITNPLFTYTYQFNIRYEKDANRYYISCGLFTLNYAIDLPLNVARNWVIGDDPPMPGLYSIIPKDTMSENCPYNVNFSDDYTFYKHALHVRIACNNPWSVLATDDYIFNNLQNITGTFTLTGTLNLNNLNI